MIYSKSNVGRWLIVCFKRCIFFIRFFIKKNCDDTDFIFYMFANVVFHTLDLKLLELFR